MSTAAFLPLLSSTANAVSADPVVLIHGWGSNGDTFRELIPKLKNQGFTVLDFDASKADVQAMSFAPTASAQHISYVAGKIVQPKIQSALAAAGYPATQHVHIVAHSMGGLVARFLIDQPNADVDYWSSSTGWYGDGVADVRSDWASRVDDLIMLGTPNHGTWEAWVPATIGGFGVWNAAGGDMVPNSKFLTLMGYAAHAGIPTHSIGGDPTYLQAFQYDYNGDGVKHGFDGVVPAESPYLSGEQTFDLVNNHHGELLTADAPIDLVIQFLGVSSSQTGVGKASLAGTAFLRLEYLHVASNHDCCSANDYRLDFSVDPDGSVGSQGYQSVGSIHYSASGVVTQNWGDTGPTTAGIALPGTSPVMDVKVALVEEDPFSETAVSTFYLTALTQSEDVDGMNYYKATAPDSSSGTNEVRVSMNGATSNVASTRYVTMGFDKAYIKDCHDPWPSNPGEVMFTIHAGRKGYTGTVYRGDAGSGTHYSRESNTWVDIGVDAKSNGVVESETVWSGRVLNNATIRFDLTYWEDDGGWSSVDGGNMYYLEKALSAIADGKTTYSGTTLPDWNVYIWVNKAPEGPGGSGSVLPVEELPSVLLPTSLVDHPDAPRVATNAA